MVIRAVSEPRSRYATYEEPIRDQGHPVFAKHTCILLLEMKSILVLLMALLALVSHDSVAEAKPTIAVLGLEVIDNGNVDKETTRAALRLAHELREQAKRPDGKYGFAPNSAKDLLELKLLSGCSDEGRTCMADIGKNLGADRLLYGKLERRRRGYQVSLKLLNTKTKQMEKTTSELIPAADLKSNKINKWARSLYARLIGVPESGSLAVSTNVSKGTVYIDGVVAITLRDGSAKVLGLSEGTHVVTIEANGYVRYEAEVAIAAGSTENLSVSLSATGSGSGGGDDEEDDGMLWKVGFFGGVLVTGAMATGLTYTGLQVIGKLEDDKVAAWDALQQDGTCQTTGQNTCYREIAGTTADTVDDSCGKARGLDVTGDNGSLNNFIATCKDGEDAATRTNLFIAGTAVAALATAYLGYQGWVVHGGSNKERRAKAGTRKKNRVIVRPHLSEHSVGAGLSLDF